MTVRCVSLAVAMCNWRGFDAFVDALGHCWRQGRPASQTPIAACVDYSAGMGGDLVAYRRDGEPLAQARFARAS
jgi:hypothetical protein